MERQQRVCVSIFCRGLAHRYCNAGLHSYFSLLSPKSRGTASTGCPVCISCAQYQCHCCQAMPWGISLLYLMVPYGTHSQVALERGVCGQPSWGKEEDFFPGLGGETCRGGTNLQLHCGTKVSGSFSGGHGGLWFHPMAQGPTAAGTQPVVLLAKGEVHSAHQVSALFPRKRQAHKHGKEKAQDKKH